MLIRALSQCLLSTLLAIHTLTAFAENGEKYVFAVEDSWPPFAKLDGTGISRSIIEEALSYSNSNAEFIVVPYARALRMAENGQVDGVFNVTKQGSTLEKFAFGNEPLLQAKASYFYPADQDLGFRRPADIPDGTIIGLIIGYEYGNDYEIHRHRFKEIRVSHQAQIIQMLIDKKVSMAIMFDKVAEFTISEMQQSRNAISKGHINHISDIFLAFSRKSQNLDKKIKLLDNGLATIKNKKE